MKGKNWQRFIAVFMIMLVLTIPFYVSTVFAQAQPVPEPGQACEEKKEDPGIAKLMDNSIISMLEKIFTLMHMICTIFSSIDSILSALGTILNDDCCILPVILHPVCEAFTAMYTAWEYIYKGTFISGLCCIANCSWCGGGGSPRSYFADIPEGAGDCFGIPAYSGAFASVGSKLDPYASIYEAMFCLCPPGILYNLRKLQTIYKTYNCCVDAACEQGISIEACDNYLSQATCMFWEGSLYMAIVKLLAGFLVDFLVNKLMELLIQANIPLKCWIARINLLFIPQELEALGNAMEMAMKTFDDPDCSELLEDNLGLDPDDYEDVRKPWLRDPPSSTDYHTTGQSTSPPAGSGSSAK